MILFFAIVIILAWASRTPVGEPYIEWNNSDPRNNGTKEKFVLDHAWEFESVEDCMEFRELRQTGWKGNASDFYKWREEE